MSAKDSVKRRGAGEKLYRSEKWAEFEKGLCFSTLILFVEVCDGTSANGHRRRSGKAAHKTKYHERDCVVAQSTPNHEAEAHPVAHVVDYKPSVDLRQGAEKQGARAETRT